MNEEYEDEQRPLGGLPDDILDERGEMVYTRTPIPGAPGPASARSAQQAMALRESTGKAEGRKAGVTGTPAYKANVQATFDVRPVNAVDKIFGGIMQVRVPPGGGAAPITCLALTSVTEVTPLNITFNPGTGETQSQGAFSLVGCDGYLSYAVINPGGGLEARFRAYDTSDNQSGLFNFYLWDDTDTLVDSLIGVVLENSPVDVFFANANGTWTFAMTGNDSTATSNGSGVTLEVQIEGG